MKVCSEVRLEEDCTSVMSSLMTPAIDSTTFSAKSPSHDSERHNGKPIPICEHCKKQWHTKEQCWKLHGCLPKGAIAQIGISQSFSLISIDWKNLWILDSRATNHLTGFSEHFMTYIPCARNEKNLSSRRMIGIAQHSMGLYLLDDDVSSSISFPSQPYKPTQPFTFVHNDVWGPSKVTTPLENSGSMRMIGSRQIPPALILTIRWAKMTDLRIRSGIFAHSLRGIRLWDANVFALKYRVDGTLDRCKAGSKEGISVSRRKYTYDSLAKTGMMGCCFADGMMGCWDDSLVKTGPCGKADLLVSHISYVMSTAIMYLGEARSKEQGVVTRSSVEVEYKAMSLGIREEIWLQKVLLDLRQDS
ncbi:putative mitochondrial protein [Cucumis melo var. makuwa]|uniref:Mitochondrial protein n=1 Tax=Cucumis melo var. makuwa TaxID=1194695 RepID=A0A5A7VQX0_CUCMM|nr:putative mitochondrial protein [Cucumis melo var. makuwa]